MIPAPFEYKRATSLDEAVGLLATEDAKVLAGGHSLIPLLRLRHPSDEAIRRGVCCAVSPAIALHLSR